MSAGSGVLRCVESAARLSAALARASTPADPYRWRVFDVCKDAQTGDCDSVVHWRSFPDLLADEALMDAWVGSYGERDARREVGGAVTALRVCAPVMDLVVGLLVVDQCAVPLPSEGVQLGLDSSGRIIGIALRDGTLVIDPSGKATGDPATARGALASYLAGELSALLQPAFEAIRTRSRYGLRGMWGQAVDEIAAAAMRRARLLGLDDGKAWRAAAELTDALAAVEPLVRRRPSAYAAEWSNGEVTFAVKGTCCLYFKVSADCDKQAYCMSCPLLADAERAPRAASVLQREYERLCRRPRAA